MSSPCETEKGFLKSELVACKDELKIPGGNVWTTYGAYIEGNIYKILDKNFKNLKYHYISNDFPI